MIESRGGTEVKHPLQPAQGEPYRPRSSRWNSEPEVGNMGIFCGNWGKRGTLGGNYEQRRRDEFMTLQIARNFAPVIVFAEAEERLQHLLMHDRSRGNPDGEGVLRRDAHEYMVVRGQEEVSLLIGARTDTCKRIELKHWEVNDDHLYKEQRKLKKARTLFMV